MSLDSDNRWPGFAPAEALRWSRAILDHSPLPLPAVVKAQMSTAISKGTPVASHEWLNTAEAAREVGFTPDLYHSLFDSLWRIDAKTFKWHPKHRQIVHGTNVPGQPFEPQLWSGWPQMVVDDGFAPGTATEFALILAEATYRS